MRQFLKVESILRGSTLYFLVKVALSNIIWFKVRTLESVSFGRVDFDIKFYISRVHFKLWNILPEKRIHGILIEN